MKTFCLIIVYLLLLNIFSTQLIISAVPWDLEYGAQRLRPQQEELHVARVCPCAVAQHLEVKCELAELRGRAPLGLRVDSGHFPVPRPPPRPIRSVRSPALAPNANGAVLPTLLLPVLQTQFVVVPLPVEVLGGILTSRARPRTRLCR